MDISALLLHALKGTCALNCLAALHLAGPRPVTQRTVMDLTGFDDGAVRKGLHTLLVLGLVTCSGDQRHTGWQLAPASPGLPAALWPLLAMPQKADSEALKEEVEEVQEQPEQINLTSSSDSAANPQKADSSVSEKWLRPRFYAAFETAEIYIQFRRPLVDSLVADDGAAWLRQTLGWICYAQRRLPHVKRGAVVYISLRDRLPCDPAYLPPAGLPFEAALAWAARGGEAEPEPDQAGDEAEMPAEPGPGESPEAALWNRTRERLSRELPASLMAAHLGGLRLAALDEQRCVLATRSAQSRDWLARRLTAVVARALTEESGQRLTVEFVCE
jgi:hypothetical protein